MTQPALADPLGTFGALPTATAAPTVVAAPTAAAPTPQVPMNQRTGPPAAPRVPANLSGDGSLAMGGGAFGLPNTGIAGPSQFGFKQPMTGPAAALMAKYDPSGAPINPGGPMIPGGGATPPPGFAGPLGST